MENRKLAESLGVVLPRRGVLEACSETGVYDADAFTLVRRRPDLVVFPENTAQLAQTLRRLADLGAVVVTRGSGTGLAGGATPLGHATTPPDTGGPGRPTVLVCTSRMRTIHHIDLPGRWAHVDAGVLNQTLSDEVALRAEQTGWAGPPLHFAPDPSSARASTLGGNAATNAGGVHTLKDFVTSNHVLGVTFVTAQGDVVTTGGRNGCVNTGPFDLTALMCGSEGTLGVIAELVVRLTPKRGGWRTLLALFDEPRRAGEAVSGVIAAGILPAALEMLDGTMVRVIEDAYHFGIPPATKAMLVAELDGEDALLDAELEQVRQVMARCGATEVRVAATADDRAKLWKARKSAFGAIGKVSHSYCTQDACVPRSRLADMLEIIHRVGEKHGIVISNVFHAGDGNVHPIFLYDDRDDAQVRRALSACAEVLEAAIALGGTITGEHGVGIEKVGLMPRLFGPAALDAFAAIKDAFDPEHRLNPGKLLPDPAHDYAVIRSAPRP